MEFFKWQQANPGKTWSDYVSSGGMNTGMSMGVTPDVTPSMVTAGNTNLGADNTNGWSWDSSSFNPGNEGFSDTMSGLASGVGAVGGIYSMMQGRDMMKLAKKDMNLRKDAYQTARADKDRFLSASKTAFA